MKKAALLLLGLIVVAAIMASASAAPENRKIVVFDQSISAGEREAVVKEHGCAIVHSLSIIPAVAVVLPEQAGDQALEAISRHASVKRIEDDAIVTACVPGKGNGKKPPPPPPPQPAQTLPWGIDRIDAELAWPDSTGNGIRIGIVDTGIDIDHPDLVNNLAGGVNFIRGRNDFNDDNGHGTHVAGIAAAVSNDIGVVGVANQARLYGVKVLNGAGNGRISDIIAGLEWCLNNDMDVVNMSLGASTGSTAFHDAVIVLYDAGIIQVAASGNDGGAVLYPAAWPEVIAVAATDSGDNVMSWSNSGPEVDLAAPGVAVNSTYRGGGYKELAGTSMATPHVAGTVALILQNQPAYSFEEVLSVLTSTADDLGFPAIKQGAGLVDADEAVLVTK